MCICINCKWVDRCKTYHSVEKQHGVHHLTSSPDFQGGNPRIHVNVMDLKNGQYGIEWDVRGCGSFIEDNGKWIRLRPGEEIPS